MKTSILAVAALAVATPALAQNTYTGVTALNDRITAVETAANDDMARSNDAMRFGAPDRRQGLSGNVALTFAGVTGNKDTMDLALVGRLQHAAGPWVQTLGMALEYQEAKGVAAKKEVFGVYDVNYYFNDRAYAFGLGRIKTDALASGTAIRNDAFVGFGPGYRVINTDQTTWRVQAGIGYSWSELADGTKREEVGYIASSRVYHRFTDNVFVTNDTDVLKTDSALRVNNDLGVNFQITDKLATRASYLTDYNDSRAIKTDNKLGLSLVFGF